MKIIAFIFACSLATTGFAQNSRPNPQELAHQVCNCAQQANLVEMSQQNQLQRNEYTGRGLQASLQKTLECMGTNTISKQLADLDFTARKKFEENYLQALQQECPQVKGILYK